MAAFRYATGTSSSAPSVERAILSGISPEESSSSVGQVVIIAVVATFVITVLVIVFRFLIAEQEDQCKPARRTHSEGLRRLLDYNARCVVGGRPALESIRTAVAAKLPVPPTDKYSAEYTRNLLERVVSRLALIAQSESTLSIFSDSRTRLQPPPPDEYHARRETQDVLVPVQAACAEDMRGEQSLVPLCSTHSAAVVCRVAAPKAPEFASEPALPCS